MRAARAHALIALGNEGARVRIVVHDYSGHPFQVQLSRELARRGHEVLHLSCDSFVTGKGALSRQPDDPPTFSVEAVSLGQRFEKYSYRKRLGQERRYGRLLGDRVREYRPDVVLSSNTPLFAQSVFQRHLDPATRFVFWQQDVYSVAMGDAARKGIPVVGALVAKWFERLERKMLEASDEIVIISADFRPILDRWGIDPTRVTVVENWAPLSEIEPGPHQNDWSSAHGLDGSVVVLYAGTLGLKHNPNLLLQLATRNAQPNPNVRVVVISEGLGADWLAEQQRALGVDNLLLLPFQPYEELSSVLASADIVVAILEPEAGVFSVPSKVLTYHCAGRPILGSIPPENLAARIITREGSGLVSDPGDVEQFVEAAGRILGDETVRAQMGAHARAYAEKTFDIARIGDEFEAVLQKPS
ncbi:MAG TPA: glycosyltransferase family 4 protein [Acidimicrobiia bacterium]|nr:glycosyltransferase family 4 protein [Acidimicrobiia bacterium]